MTTCGFIHFPDTLDPEPGDKAWACKKEATHTCCDYGGYVCEDHKCRCSKPLPEAPKQWKPPEEIIQNLLEFLRESEWRFTMIRCGRGCCQKPGYECPSCEMSKEKGHTEGCSLVAAMREAEDYLNPPSSGAQTIWERIDHEVVPCHES